MGPSRPKRTPKSPTTYSSSRAKRPLAVPKEAARLGQAWVKHGVFGLPLRLGKSFLKAPGLAGTFAEARLLDIFGDNALAFFNELGPIYGKAGQMVLSRLSPPLQEIAESLRLTRLYKDWPPLPFAEIEQLLDEEIPLWRVSLKVDPLPLGVASLAQVHAATDSSGRRWVIKVIKPQARKRLMESVAALEQVVAVCEPLAVTLTTKRFLREARELCVGFRQELSLKKERETIERVQEKLKTRRQKLLLIPEVLPEFCTEQVLVLERFEGTSLADVVAGKVSLSVSMRQKLARDMLSELLVQVFELGLFHADPHAGNLILMPDGSVGIFDWGLSGELLENDRRHIAGILRAVMALNVDQLVDVLIEMGEENGKTLTRDAVKHELSTVIRLIKRGRAVTAQEQVAAKGNGKAKVDEKMGPRSAPKKPSLQQLFEACLKGAARLGIDVPEGLLMMAKSLITIEGLAKGLDPKMSLSRVATPVLLRAAKPSLKDLLALGRRLPQVARQLFIG